MLARFALFVSCCTLPIGQAKAHGSYHDVVEKIEKKLKVSPNDAALRYRLAEAHAGHYVLQACLDELDQVERLAPGKYQVDFLRGLALFNAEKYNEALNYFDEFLIAQPYHTGALATRGRIHLKHQRPGEAMADLKQAVDLSTDPETSLIADLARSYAAAGKPEEASKVIDASLKTNGSAPDLLQCALQIESSAGLWDCALGRIAAIQKNAPRPEPWMARRAELLQVANRKEESRASWAALRAHLLSLPNLERGTPLLASLLSQSEIALGNPSQNPVIAPPKP